MTVQVAKKVAKLAELRFNPQSYSDLASLHCRGEDLAFSQSAQLMTAAGERRLPAGLILATPEDAQGKDKVKVTWHCNRD